MSALRKQSFKPILEALEDRCLLSATPLTVQFAEAAIARIVQEAQQMLATAQTAEEQMLATAADTAQEELFGGVVFFFESARLFVSIPKADLSPNFAGKIASVVYPKGGGQPQIFYRWQPPGNYNILGKWIPAPPTLQLAPETSKVGGNTLQAAINVNKGVLQPPATPSGQWFFDVGVQVPGFGFSWGTLGPFPR